MVTPVEEDDAAVYAQTYVARVAGLGPAITGVPGLHGVRTAHDPASVRLLVVDDRALEGLAGLLPSVTSGRVAVFDAAERCAAAVADGLGWASSTTTSMTLRHLPVRPPAPLPGGLVLRVVDSGRAGVSMEQAVGVAVAADPGGVGDTATLVRDLRAWTPALRVFAAVDGDGVPRATSGVGVHGSRAVVVLVNTVPGWRRRGLGRAMTDVALADARSRGALTACLDASSAGVSLYQRLGFDVTARTRRSSRERRSVSASSP